ncbi:MAG TPA: HAD family hydrolase, partial [Cupriavidus sp.]|nr:HAD family hydrolase [Cupriavidus sp.]
MEHARAPWLRRWINTAVAALVIGATATTLGGCASSAPQSGGTQ